MGLARKKTRHGTRYHVFPPYSTVVNIADIMQQLTASAAAALAPVRTTAVAPGFSAIIAFILLPHL
eukprot:3820171-Pyramimonas_sp.AAC.1